MTADYHSATFNLIEYLLFSGALCHSISYCLIGLYFS
jgi:hypothetical protein